MDSCFALKSRSAAGRAQWSGGRLLLWAAVLASYPALGPAYGLELGAVQMLSGLGEPLSLQLPLRWASGEARSADCLKLSVEAGERRLTSSELQQSLLKGADATSAVISVRSKLVMMEPVLMLTIGCPAQQVMALVDPVHTMLAPAGGIKSTSAAPSPLDLPDASSAPSVASPPVRVRKVRAERVSPGPQLRLSTDSLPPLTMADAEAPGLRWRFDSDLGGSATVAFSARGPKPTKGQEFRVRKGAPGESLLMSIDIGRPAGPADLLMAQDGPERLARAQAQFTALLADHRALKLELDKLAAVIAARDAAAANSRQWLVALALGVAALAAGAAYFVKRRGRGS